MADWYGSRDQIMSLHGLDSAAMLGYGVGMGAATAFPPIQPDAYSHAHAAAAAAYNFQRQQSVTAGFPPTCFASDQQWRHGADGSIMEIRKEKSRDAARSRRGKENFEFYELAKMLPLPPAITSQLDKASIIRLTISYLKLKEFTSHGDPPWSQGPPKNHKSNLRHRSTADLTMEMFEVHQGTHILQSLDGFAFSLAADGRFLYISETVSIYLGLSQVEMTGSSVFDYIHQEDHQEFADQLGLTLAVGQCLPSPSSLGSEDASVSSSGTPANPDGKLPLSSSMSVSSVNQYKGFDRAFCVRMKSTLTKRGCHFKSSGFRVLLLLGHIRPHYAYTHGRKPQNSLLGFVCLAMALPPPTVHEVRLEPDMFVTRLSFDFRIAHCEPKASDLMDYSSDELQGRSLYSLCHGQDTDKLRKSHMDLIKKGQVMTPYFRILNKRGGYTWMQICATIICNSKSGEEQTIICVNYIISRCVYDSLILDEFQLDPSLIGMKTDSMDYSTRASPDHTTDIPRVRGEDTGVCSPTVPASGVASICDNQSPQPDTILEPSATPHQNSPETSTEGAHIKTEIPGNLLTPVGSSEPMDESRIDPVGQTSPISRISISPCSTPSNRQTRATKTLTNLTPSSILGAPSIRTEEGSVRELEAAMTRHLPDEAPDFSTDALLRNSSTSAASGSRPTIQWVGGTGSQQASSSASTLLRQLYANRESVIRTSVPRSYYPEVQSTLPTPPGHDGYQESMFSKGHDFSGYNASSAPISNTIGSVGMTGTYADYHSAMTPPSSVSPREKMVSECSELRTHASYLSDLGGGVPAAPLPLKPQVYSYTPSGLDAHGYASSLAEQAPLYPSSGFHLYNSNSNKPSGSYDALRSGSPWYSSSS